MLTVPMKTESQNAAGFGSWRLKTINRNNSDLKNDDENSRNFVSDQLEGWWCSSLEARNIHGYDSPVQCLGSSGCRVLRGGISRNVDPADVWDVSDLMIEMTEIEKRREKMQSSMTRGASGPQMPRFSSQPAWLAADRSNGFIGQ